LVIKEVVIQDKKQKNFPSSNEQYSGVVLLKGE
jgi:hypothetical protein